MNFLLFFIHGVRNNRKKIGVRTLKKGLHKEKRKEEGEKKEKRRIFFKRKCRDNLKGNCRITEKVDVRVMALHFPLR
jgi:hypothetical protein